MSNTAPVIPIKPHLKVVEHRVADTDDGFMRVANELTDSLLKADLTARQLKIMLAIMRKTYGFNKSMDRLTNTQIAEMTGIHHTHICAAKRQLINRKFLVADGVRIGVNKVVSQWISQDSLTLANAANKTLAKPANGYKPIQLNTKDNIQNTIKTDPPKSPNGVEAFATECLDYYNQLSGARCSSTTSFEKALSTVKAKGICYSVDEVKLVIRWALTCWKSRKTLPKPNNICTMTRFDGYLSDALVWADGNTQNPSPCPHDQIIAIWNEKFPDKAIATQEWTRRRPAYSNLEAVWNGKTNRGSWREVGHISTAFELIRKSSLFASAETKPWLTLDWILNPKNWGQVYEQAINEHRARKGQS